MRRLFLGHVVLLVCIHVFSQQTASFTIGDPLQSNMVIQQGKPMKIWGTAPAGEIIKIKADWLNNAVIVQANQNNEWTGKIQVPAITAGDFQPHAISITHDSGWIVLTNILIGEVWLCSGQSNMDMQLKPFLPWLKGVLDFENEIAAANHPEIRLLDIQTDFKASPAERSKGTWKICTPANAADFSAVAYYFGLELLNKLHVPVGLITSAVGASGCQAWTSRETLSADTALNAKYLYPFDTSAVSKETLDSVVTFEKVLRPTLLYNAMIYPLRNISLRGFLWYQGESNKDDGAMYTKLCTAMIHNWRGLFDQGNLPFYFVQVAPYNWLQNDSTAFNYAVFREAQEGILKEKNTGMALTMDIGDPDDIHPRDKKNVGIRLAFDALANTYGLKEIANIGPQFSGYSVGKDHVIISFEKKSIGAGLTTSDGKPPEHFFIAGADKVFYPAVAEIRNDKVLLYSSKVKDPVAVRYAFTNYPMTNFCNKAGLPAMPFRTDAWDSIGSPKTTAQQ